MSCIMMHLSALYLLFLPIFLQVDPETNGAAGYDYTADDQAFAAEQQGKQPPLSIPILPIPFPLILALGFCYCIS